MSDEVDAAATLPASMLGEYKVIKEIAEGTFGKVKMGIHTVTGHTVAMKYLSKQVIQTTRTKNRVQREVEYMRALRHPHIIKLYEVISTPTDIIIVLEYAGGELFNYIVANGRMHEAQARRFFQQIISGVDYAHKCKIVHRDLKPENVLLDDDLNVKIADFGLSNEIKDGDFLKTSCGSPNYAAPEVIRGGLYTGPEIDVWSCGVILYVMLCGRLPFEDEDVHTLFSKITQGLYHMPSYLSSDARNLINSMLVVDPVKRITIPDILNHPFYTTDLPRYLQPLPPLPGPVVGTLSSLVVPGKTIDFEIIEGLGRIEESVVEELSEKLKDVDKETIWECLRRDDGVQGNAVKVAYLLLRDKQRLGHDLAAFEEAERDAQLAARDPRNLLSPNALSPSGNDIDENPFENEFNEYYDDEDVPTDLDFNETLPPTDGAQPPLDVEVNNFAVLNSSLPDGEPHHLESYANAKRSWPTEKEMKKKQHRTKWHFGIRSRSPPMEVMLEIYRTLKTLGMEWKEKKYLGGLGTTPAPNLSRRKSGHGKVERAREHDGEMIDLKAASSIYFVETRARAGDVVVLMNLQLYMVDSINYLVDFHHRRTYRASKDPDAGKFDAENPETLSEPDPSNEVVSPFVFMDLACRLILELAGGGE